MKKTIINGLLFGIFMGFGLFSTIIGYGVWTNLSTQNDGDIITKDIWNDVVNKVNQNGNDVDLLKNNSTNVVPKGAVMAFFGSTCPTGWNLADGSGDETKTDGTNGTLDLRGEFIRGLDNGRGIDTGRVLGSKQISTQVIVDNDDNEVVGAIDWTTNNLVNLGYENSSIPSNVGVGLHYNSSTYKSSSNSSFLRGIRPNNVALLYCIKN